MATKEPDIEKETSEPRAKLTCSICLDAYKEPKVLPCCHTFCRACLEGLVTAKTDSAGGKRESGYEHDGQEGCRQPDYSMACGVGSEKIEEGVSVYEGYKVGKRAAASTEKCPTYAVAYIAKEEPNRLYESGRDQELCWGESGVKEVGIATPETSTAYVVACFDENQHKETQEDVGICKKYEARETDAKEKLRCPECRTEHDVPKQGVEGFLTDFSLVADVEEPVCGECEGGEKAVVYCHDCEAFVCEGCVCVCV